MADAMNDLFMYMLDENDNTLPCESAIMIAKGDPFMTEFKPAGLDSYSNYFDVTEFEFALALDDSSKGGAGAGGAGAGAAASAGSSIGSFGDWYMADDPLTAFSSNDKRYRIKKISGSIGKVVDSASPGFFQNCCNKKTYNKAILVKRAFTGAPAGSGGGGIGFGLSASAGAGGLGASASLSFASGDKIGESQALGYLRILMTDVRITSVSWEDGDLLQEKLGFKCQHMEIVYRQQNDPGDLRSQIQLMNWTYTVGNTPSNQ